MRDHADTAPDASWQSNLEAAADSTAISAILEARGRDDEAVQALQAAVALFEKVLGEHHHEVGVALERLAQLLIRTHRIDEAARCYERALAIFERTLGRRHLRTATCRANRDEALGRSSP